jgi:hypothetical protein
MKLIGSRRCPKCNTKVNWVRFYLQPGWWTARWSCTGCNTVLCFDQVGRTVFSVGVLISTACFLWCGGDFLLPYVALVLVLSVVDGVAVAAE